MQDYYTPLVSAVMVYRYPLLVHAKTKWQSTVLVALSRMYSPFLALSNLTEC